MLDRIGASWRAQNRAAASALAAIGELFSYRLARCSDTEDWAVDTEAAVSAEVAAALRMSQGLAASQFRYARASRAAAEAAVVFAGEIDQRTFATIVYPNDLITDRDLLATVDGQLALTVVRAIDDSRPAGRTVARSSPRPTPMRSAAARSDASNARSGSPISRVACRKFTAAC